MPQARSLQRQGRRWPWAQTSGVCHLGLPHGSSSALKGSILRISICGKDVVVGGDVERFGDCRLPGYPSSRAFFGLLVLQPPDQEPQDHLGHVIHK